MLTQLHTGNKSTLMAPFAVEDENKKKTKMDAVVKTIFCPVSEKSLRARKRMHRSLPTHPPKLTCNGIVLESNLIHHNASWEVSGWARCTCEVCLFVFGYGSVAHWALEAVRVRAHDHKANLTSAISPLKETFPPLANASRSATGMPLARELWSMIHVLSSGASTP